MAPEHHSRQWFEKLFEDFAADYHLSDASDFLSFQALVTRSIECLSFRNACELFEVEGCRSYKALGAVIARRFVVDRDLLSTHQNYTDAPKPVRPARR